MKAVRRWFTPALMSLALAASLIAVVRRGEEGRALAERIAEREAEARVIADRIVAERVRIDSLSSRSRIAEAAGALGLRQAVEGELVRLREAPKPAESGRGESVAGRME